MPTFRVTGKMFLTLPDEKTSMAVGPMRGLFDA